MHPVRTYTFPVEGKHHGARKGCHPPCHGHHGHDHHQHHHGYHHQHHRVYNHHQTHNGHQHSQGLHHKHGHRKFARAIYQDPYYHVSPQLFYHNNKPFHHGVSQYYSQKLSPYWFPKYYYSPYQMKPLIPTYNYHLKPLYYYLRNPQIVAPVAWIQPQEYHLYPINNQGSSENSLSVEDPPSNNQVNHNVHDSIYEETDVPNVQIQAENDQSDDTFSVNDNLFTEVTSAATTTLENKVYDNFNNNGDSSDDSFSVNDNLFTEVTSAATTNLENKLHDNFNNNGDSTSYNNVDHTTPQYTSSVHLDKNYESTPSVWITESLENSNDDTNADHTTPQYKPSLINLDKNYGSTPSVWITESLENSKDDTNADHTTPQYKPSLINLIEINKSETPSVTITETYGNVNQETTTLNDLDRIYTTKSDDSFNSGVPDSLMTSTPIYVEKDIENARSTTYEPSGNFHQETTTLNNLDRIYTTKSDDSFNSGVPDSLRTSTPSDVEKDIENARSTTYEHSGNFNQETTTLSDRDRIYTTKSDDSFNSGVPDSLRTSTPSDVEKDIGNARSTTYEPSGNFNQETTTLSDLDRILTTKSDDSFNSGVPDSLRTSTPSDVEKDIENARSTTYEPIPITDSLEHKVTIGDEPSLKVQTVATYSPLEIIHEQTTQNLPGRDQVVDLEDSLSLTTGADDNNSDGGVKYGGTTIPDLLRTKLDDYQTSTTRSYYDVTSTGLSSDKNGVELPNHDPIFTTTESFKNDVAGEYEKLQTTPTNFHEQSRPTTVEKSSHLSHETSTFSPEPFDRYYTTTEKPREYEGLTNLPTTSQNRFGESTTVSSSLDAAAYTLTLDEEVMLFEDFIKAFMEDETAPPQIDFSSEAVKSGTGIEIDVGTTVSAIGGDDIKSFVEESSTSDNWKTVTTFPAYTSMTDSGLNPDYNNYRGLKEEIQSERSTVPSDYQDLEGEIQSEKSSVTLDLIETTMSTPITRALNEEKYLEKDTVLVTSSPKPIISDGDYREDQTENSNTIAPTSATSNFTDFTITGSELVPGNNNYRGLEEEFQNGRSTVTSDYEDLEGEIRSEKSSVTPYLLETTMSTPITRSLNEEKYLEKDTVLVTSSPKPTNSDGDFREVQTENSKTTELTSATSLFTDFTEASGNEFPKLEAQSTTPYAGSSIFTDSTENSNVWLSGFKFESNSVQTTPLSVHYDSTGNHLLSTPDSLKIESPDFSTVNTDFDKFSSDNLRDEILMSTTGNTVSDYRFKSGETTTDSNWNMEESIEFKDEKSSTSKVSEKEFLENREQISVTEAWNEKISFTTIGTTTMNTPASDTVEKEIELKDLVEKEVSTQKIEESEKLNDLDDSITTENNVSIHGDSSNDLEKFSKDQNHSNFVTSKTDPIDDSNVFEQVETTTIHQGNKMEQEKDFENMEIGSIDKFYGTTTPTLEILVSPTVEDGEIYRNTKIQSVRNSATTFEPLGDIKNGGDFVDTTESSYTKLDTTESSYTKLDTTESSHAKSNTTESSYDKSDTTKSSYDVGKLSYSTNENPNTETPEYFHENLPGETKNVIIDAPVPSDIQYPEVTNANLLNDTTSLLKTVTYDQSTIQPIELQTQYPTAQLDTGRDELDKISGEESWVDENNADYDDLSGLELSTEVNLNTRTNVSSDELEVQGELLNENNGNEAEKEESKLNELNRNQNISQEEKIDLQNTSQNNNSLIIEKNIDETTISSEAETGLNAYSSNQETIERVDDENAFGQAHLKDTVDEHDTSKVINETQRETDGVMRVYDELDSSFPNSETAQQNDEFHNKTEAVEGKTNVSEGSTPVTEVGLDSGEGTTEVSPLKQLHETLFTKSFEEGVGPPQTVVSTVPSTVGSTVENDTIDETDNVESSTRTHLSDFTEMESSGYENKGGETVPPNSNSGNDDGPFHVDLLNINATAHENNSETKLTNKTSVIEEVTYYNIENLGDNSHRDELFVTVNDDEMNRTGFQSEGDSIDINGDDLTDNYELTRSIRYEYNPYFIISNSDLNFREPDSNNMNYENDHSAIPRYIVKRDVMKTKERKVPEDFIDDKREMSRIASPRILESSYQAEEGYSEEEEYRDYSDYGTVSNASPLSLKESEEDEEEDNLTNDFGPSIKELIAYRRNKQ
ncbi:probable serine/threonine-protein kinase DDB_G0282963 isoform X2 [Nilaparvata lugens]|uniref:probable serine/threonine-protein kinase DDB_G0282963 isoform X2 n=1 Tax=Nilaparvata lugens TaxID=108931 RepID=UPI00193D8714|nr:probable serine/threonine-protein kinase DDB_G0282963 isoform X2 [Nilaparvata lugens]